MTSYLRLRYPDRNPGDDPPVLLLDANILIDLAKIDPAVLVLLCRSLGPVAVLPTTVAEVRQLKLDDYPRFGIPIEEPTSEEYAAATRLAAHSTPANDDLCLAACRSRDWMLATNDGALKGRCERAGVSIIRGLELLLALVEKDALSRTGAETVARRLHDDSPGYFHEKLLAWFLAELDAIAGSRG